MVKPSLKDKIEVRKYGMQYCYGDRQKKKKAQCLANRVLVIEWSEIHVKQSSNTLDIAHVWGPHSNRDCTLWFECKVNREEESTLRSPGASVPVVCRPAYWGKCTKDQLQAKMVINADTNKVILAELLDVTVGNKDSIQRCEQLKYLRPSCSADEPNGVWD